MSVKAKVKLALEEIMKAQSRRRDLALLFFLTSVLDGGGWLMLRPGHFTPGNDLVPIV
jgi:hypothetical protein